MGTFLVPPQHPGFVYRQNQQKLNKFEEQFLAKCFSNIIHVTNLCPSQFYLTKVGHSTIVIILRIIMPKENNYYNLLIYIH